MIINIIWYLEETSINQLQYHCPDPDYYRPPPRRSNGEPRDQNGYYPPPPDPADSQCWYARGRYKHALLHGYRFFGEKTRSAESHKV